jgi:hypothetical protein
MEVGPDQLGAFGDGERSGPGFRWGDESDVFLSICGRKKIILFRNKTILIDSL